METQLGVVNRTYVYRVPPAKTTQGQYAKDWDLANPLLPNPLRMRVVERGGNCFIKLEDPNGQLFAECAYSDQTCEKVLDSSRYFVLTLLDERGRRAQIGIGFQDKSEAFDFNAAVDQFFRYKRQEVEAAKAAQQWESQPHVDLSIPQGQSIKVNIKSNKPKPAQPQATSAGGNNSSFVLAAPPAASHAGAPQQRATTNSADTFAIFNQSPAAAPKPAGAFDSNDWTDFSSSGSPSGGNKPAQGGGDWTSFF